jgi:glutamate-1-semialdehyde 2,1-aminomutase
MRTYARSAEMLNESKRYLAGGVSSMLRAACKPVPLFFESASGARVIDVDGNQYLDYGLAWGPLILGHGHPAVVAAVRRQLEKFCLIGAQHRLETAVARKICEMVPCAQLVAFNSTGSEAVHLALRLAKAHTGRRKVIKFEGHYHGWFDNILINYHPKVTEGGINAKQMGTEGQSERVLDDVYILPWNDLKELENTLREHYQEIAAIITEPILCNSSCLMPSPGFLESLRELTTRYGIVLIFDEVITGFRVHPRGAQGLFNVTPDLATFGKAVAAGYPLSVVAGKREIMELIPKGRVVQAGTFNGNPLALAASEAALEVLSADGGSALIRIQQTGGYLKKGIEAALAEAGIPALINGVGSAFHISFTAAKKLSNYRETLNRDDRMRDQFIEGLLGEGIYLLPDGRWYVSAAHTEADVDVTMAAVRKVCDVLKRSNP